MIDFQNLIKLQGAMFIDVIIGIILSKKMFITKEGRKSLTNLVIYVILPCSILNSFLNTMESSVLLASLHVLILSSCLQIICFLISKFIYRNATKQQLPTLQYGTIASNAAFMGSPIAEGLFGAEGLLYASIYLIPQRIFMWTVGLRCFTKEEGKGVFKKVITHPCIVAVEIGVVIMAFQMKVPEYIS